MNRLLTFYVISALMIGGAIFAIWDKSDNYASSEYATLFPDLYRQKDDFKKIEINTQEEKILLEKKDGKWVLPEEASYSVNVKSLSNLIEWLESLKTISRKTNNPQDYNLLSLNPPKDGKTDSGIRISFWGKGKSPLIDLILGDEFKAYMMRGKKRYFVRMNNDIQAYLVEGLPALPFKNEFFIDKIQEFPVIDDIKTVKVYLDQKLNYQLNNTKFYIENSSEKDPRFLPISVPKDYKLLYPEIASDYVQALLTKIHPIHVYKIAGKLPASANMIELALKDGKNININFFKKEKNYYLFPTMNDKESLFLYQIKEDDYNGILQPFSAFLAKDEIESLNTGEENVKKHKK